MPSVPAKSFGRGRWLSRLMFALAVLALSIVVMIPSDAVQVHAALAQRSGNPTMHAWNPGFQNYGSVGSDAPTTASQDANNFDLIIDQPFKTYSNGKKYDAATIAAMHKQNPKLKILFYLSGCCDQVGKDKTNWPESAYAHNSSGNRLNSPAGVPLMNRRDSTWFNTRATHCKDWVDQYGIDGCFYDSSNWNWFSKGNPIDPKTGKVWTQSDYESVGAAMFANVKKVLGSGYYVAMNGLGSGTSYSRNKGLMQNVDMGMAENWIMSPTDSVTGYDRGSAWVADVNMAKDLAAQGKWFIPTVKSWTKGTQAQKDTLNKYAMATLLMGGDEHAYLAFEDEHGLYGGSQYYSFWNANIGSPNGSYFTSGNCYVRKFTNGVVVANPSSGSCSYSLGATMTNLDGAKVSTANLSPGEGDVFAGNCTSGCGGTSDARPTISLSAPKDGSAVPSGTTVTIAGTAADDNSLTKVDVKVDGNTVKTFTGSAARSFSASWQANSGSHSITATATDSAGQTTTDTATITVSGPGGQPCTVPATDYGSVSLTANVAASGTYRVWSRMAATSSTANTYLLEVDGNSCYTVGGSSVPVVSSSASQHFASNSSNWIAKTKAGATIDVSLASGNHTLKLIGNADGVLLDRLVLTQDTSCTPTGTGDNCANPKDTTNPIVSITAPATNTTLSGTTTVRATATDDTAVTKVDFLVDGQRVATDSSVASGNVYSFSLDPSTLGNGSHVLTATAYDAALNSATSSPVTVKVGTTPPPTTTPGDINGDGQVDFLDFSSLAGKYGQSGSSLGSADINKDGKVDFLDFSILASNYGK